MTFKRLLLLLLLFAAPAVTRAQVTVTGHIFNPDGSVPKNAKACMTLVGFTPQVPKVTGTGVIVNQKTFCVASSPVTGAFSTPLYPNFSISPSQTFWRVDYMVNGIQQSSATYNVTTSPFNLDSATPTVTFPPPPSFIQGSKTFEFAQSSPALTWTIPHGFGDKNVVFNCYDPLNKYLIPDTVVETDINTLTITFTSAQSGNCTVITGGNAATTGAVANAVVTNPNSTQVINGAPLTVQTPFNATGGGTLSGTFGGPTSLPSINSTLFAAGMRCDGSSDDTSALAASLAAAAPGTAVALPKGVCMVTSNIPVPDGVTLQGTGAQTTTLRQAAGTNDASHPILLISGTTGNVTIAGLTIDGNKAGQSSGNCLIGNSQTGDMQGFTLTKSTLMNAWNAAICFQASSGHVIRDFDISENTFLNNSTATTQGQEEGNNWGDISIRAPLGGRIHHNSSTGCQGDFAVFGTNAVNPVGHVIIDHNVVTGGMGFGVALGGGGGFGTDDIIDGNYFNMPNSRENIIDIANWNSNLITGNMIYSGVCTFCSGIGDGPPSSGTTISNNYVIANFTAPIPGLCIGNGGNVSITNNFCDGGGIGLQLAANTSVDSAVVEGNTVINARPGNPGFQTVLSGGSLMSNVLIKGNRFYDNQTPHTQTYGIVLGYAGATTGYSNFTIEGNDLRNNLTGGLQDNTVGSTGMVVRGNPGFDPLTDATGGDVIGGANISQTTLYTTPPTTFLAYRVSVTGGVTTPGSSSSTAPTVNITYVDADSNTARSIPVAPLNPTANSKASTTYNSSFLIYANTATPIGFNTSGYASSGATGMQYSLHIRIETVQ